MTDEPRRARYQVIADDLRRKISNGTFPVGSAVPSLTRLVEEYEASGTVIQRALRELKHEGVLIGQPGKAVFVERKPDDRSPSAEYTEIMNRLQGLHDALDQATEEFDARLTAVEMLVRKPRSRSREP